MFLLPGVVITWYVTETPIPEEMKIECRNYLFARQNKGDAGWGLHIEGQSTVLGTALNYTAMRLLGTPADDDRMVSARRTLHRLGGAVKGPHWAKFWLAVLGVAGWDIVNPVPPELWLLPDWVPFAPWRWWIHLRQVFLPMSYIWSKRWTGPVTETVEQLRTELYTQPYNSIDWASHRNSIAETDNYHPKSPLLNALNWGLVNVWMPHIRPRWLVDRAEKWVMDLIVMEDENTGYANLGPVNGPMNTIARFIHDGAGSEPVMRHLDHLHDFLWVKDEGMLCNGTNGVQNWDTSFAIQAIVAADLHTVPRWRRVIEAGLDFLASQQIVDDCPDQAKCYRHTRRGAWGFSNRIQGYTVSDTTAEALKAVILAQSIDGVDTKIPNDRLRHAVDVLLTMQNADTGGCASYELRRGGHWLEMLNAAEVFGGIMLEYDYPECTTAVRAGLTAFKSLDRNYRSGEIEKFMASTKDYILASQREDGSWYGSWGICFTYATMFGLESLALAGMDYASSEPVRRACAFLVDRQDPDDGGWGESYESCEKLKWVAHPDGSQVVNTAWAVIGLLEAKYPDRTVIDRAVRLVLDRQMPNGEWRQEGIEGVFNRSCMISYPNYKFIFPIKMLGMYAKAYGNTMPE